MNSLYAVAWKVLLVRGLIALIFGVVAMVWPIGTALTLVVVWGFWALTDGVVNIASAFGRGVGGGQRVFFLIVGALGLVAAFFALFRPVSSAVALTWVLGFWLVLRGAFDLMGAFASDRTQPRWLLVVSGLLAVLAGGIFMANPGAAAVGLALWLGVIAVVYGIVLLAVAFAVRSAVNETVVESHHDRPARA